MKVVETPLKDLLILEPAVYRDSRGSFLETYSKRTMEAAGLHFNFVQDNVSVSHQKTLRGFHLQKGEAGQTKLVWVVSGSVLDIVVDLRPSSPSFKKSFSIELSSDNFRQMLIPRGFAHGFVCLSETAVFSYKVDYFYSKENEIGLRFDDPDLRIALPFGAVDLIVSDKDRALPSFREIEALL